MIIINIIGGLGNQMFQYALAKVLSIKHNTQFKLDIFGFEKYKLHKYCLESLNISKNYAGKYDIPFYENLYSNNKYLNYILGKFKKICKKINSNHYIEKQLNFDNKFLNIKSGYIEGFFQSEKYFKDYEEEIRKDFTFIISPSDQNKQYINIINSCNSVSLHIRRGDYISNSYTNKIHGICDLNYYHNAIKIIQNKIDDPVFFIFSDDISWVKENLKFENKSYYIDFNNVDTNYEDMRLMSLCKHNIIANSTFSRWGSRLNKNKNKIVIAPNTRFTNIKYDYRDIVPTKWIKI